MPFRERIREALEPLTLEEVRMAIANPAQRRGPGPDLFPATPYKKLTGFHAYIAPRVHFIQKN